LIQSLLATLRCATSGIPLLELLHGVLIAGRDYQTTADALHTIVHGYDVLPFKKSTPSKPNRTTLGLLARQVRHQR